MSDISEDEARKLIENRTEFKLYAAAQHLKNLKNIEQSGTTMHSPKGRIEWEMEIESFLFHLVGISDTLLAKTNDKLDLKLKGRGISLQNIKLILNYLIEKNLLTKNAEENLLSNLGRFDKEPWFQRLRQWRNQVTHISLLPVLFSVEIPENGKPKLYFRDDQDKKLEVIPFLEDSLQSVKVFKKS
jgi:hypothetical protein